MINKGVAILYGDVAPEAKENFMPTASESQFNTLKQLQEYNLNFPNYANPCELYSVILDGKATAFPSDPENSNIGLWSEQISDTNGVFANPIVLELKSEGQYSSQGLSLTFDTYNNIFATKLSIKWFRVIDGSETLLDEKEFVPDKASYFCQNKVDNCNKIIIIFYSLNMPENRLKLRSIDYGSGTFFYGDELRNVRLTQQIDPISVQISINTADFVLDAKSNTEYSFQAKQPLSIYFNGQLKATTFVKKSTRKAKKLWNVQSEDYIGLMDSVPYYGGIYVNANAVEVLTDIFTVAKVPFKIEIPNNKTITGYIPYTTCRNALMQVAFAVQAVIDTSNSDLVKVFELAEETKQTIPLERIMQGQSFGDEDTVTGVEITTHSYKPITETIDVYDAAESGTGENIFVKFSEPLHDLSITNGEIVSRGTNYAVINAADECVLRGQKYEHTTQTKRKNNPLALANDIEKVISIDNATLVSSSNIDNLIEKCYNWLVKTKRTNLKIVEGKHIKRVESVKYGDRLYGTFKYGDAGANVVVYDEPVNVGENIEAETEYLGNVSGRLIQQSFNLNGNIIIKEAVLK